MIAPLARDAAAKVEPHKSRDATELLSRSALLLWWCHGQGLEVTPEVVERPAVFPDLRDRALSNSPIQQTEEVKTCFVASPWVS